MLQAPPRSAGNWGSRETSSRGAGNGKCFCFSLSSIRLPAQVMKCLVRAQPALHLLSLSGLFRLPMTSLYLPWEPWRHWLCLTGVSYTAVKLDLNWLQPLIDQSKEGGEEKEESQSRSRTISAPSSFAWGWDMPLGGLFVVQLLSHL